MNIKALTEIDYFRIREQVASYCIAQESKELLLQRLPLTEAKQIEELKTLSSEWTSFLNASTSTAISNWEPIHNLWAIIKTNGASLSLEQVSFLGQFILSVKKVKQAVENHKEKLKLKQLFIQTSLLPEFTDAESKIFRIITPDGELRDLPEITEIRKQIATLNNKIKNLMKEFTSDQKLSNVLESNVPVLRNGRQVLAVKSNQQNRIPGIIHEVSQSSQTVYIEPEAVVKCSNDLIQKEFELAQVIKRILTQLTLSLQPSIPEFKKALPIMELLDSTLAAAKWGKENKCIFAQDCSDESLKQPPLLLAARHPLLGEKCVPIDIRFMDGKNVLIITGPNTGGKTVTLKTFALLSMLNQSGFPIPANEGSYLTVFSNVYTDIGDDQSLDQNLSTFSSHMKNIAQAINNAKEDTLILLDELGSGTDPQEGTAIAMAVLDQLILKKSFVLVTTHMGILKNYGYTNSSCINACVEFDSSTLSPSYHLLMGVPGESHALDIAQKSGLPKNIINSARNYIATEQADVSSLIRGLNRKHVELNKIQKSAESEKKQAQEKMLKLKDKELNLRKKENEIKQGKQQELNDFLIHSRRQLENLVRNLKEGEITREKTLKVKEFISNLENSVEHFEQKTEQEQVKLNNIELQNVPTGDIKQFTQGDFVVVGDSKNLGQLIKLEKKGLWTVQFGSLKMSVKEKDMKSVKRPKDKLTPSYTFELNTTETKNNYVVEKTYEKPVFELRLLGMNTQQAIKALEHQIDLCIINNFLSFSVIHGKGDGILQQAVKDYLSNCPVVKEFNFAPHEDGGAGKTYVVLS